MQNLQIFQGPKVCQMETSNMRQVALKISPVMTHLGLQNTAHKRPLMQ